jgi:hypothetical protein
MSIDISILKTMAANGATAEMIIAVLEAEEIAGEARRKKEAERKRKYRAAKKLDDVPGTSRDIAGQARDIADSTQSSAVPQPEPTPGQVIELPGSRGEGSQQKERSPTPPKEKLSTTTQESSFLEDSQKAVSARARSRERATRLPADWMPTLDELAYARTLLREDRAQAEIEKFRDYWHARAGPGALKVSWSATWRTWCRREAEKSINGGVNAANWNGHHPSSAYRRGSPGGFAVLARELAGLGPDD